MIFYTSDGPVTLGREIGEGGEAEVFEVAGRADQLAKIYKQVPGDGMGDKLAWMVAHVPSDPASSQGHSSLAWPLALLRDDKQEFAGYLMNRIKGAVPLLNVFNPRLREKTLPDFDRRYLHRAARNLATALESLHASDYVVGDLNESNILVTPTALVTLVDSDSFQVIRQNGAQLLIYPCRVGKPEYTPPELQGRSFDRTQRSPEQDHFALAVLIFQLLMDGSHPFRAQWLGAGDPPPIEERIRQGCFPYMETPPCPVQPAANLPPLEVLHPRLADLMVRCFVNGHHAEHLRPAPGEWKRALVDAEAMLVKCGNGHYYSKHAGGCFYCGHAPRPKGVLTHLKGAATPAKPAAPAKAPAVKPASAAASSPPVSVAASTFITCHACQTKNNGSLLYCQRCSRPLLPRVCSSCGFREVPGNAVCCPRCGKL
jgi:DNA-binding helix-hairpin-helix protein with protein kinase domain